MKLGLCGIAIVSLLAVAARSFAASPADVAEAATSATPNASFVPTETPIPGTYLDVEVVHDLNKDGARQLDEPGVVGVRMHGGCGDALSQIPATDGDGRTKYRLSSYMGRVQECITLEHAFGWLETTNPVVRLDFPVGEQHAVVFLVHDLGQDVMEVYGEPILAGVPAPDATIALDAPFAGCIERPAGSPFPLVLIVGAARAGCPSSSAQVRLLLDGSPAGTIAYAPGRANLDLVARGDSMRMGGDRISGARIGGVECAVIHQVTGALIPEGHVRVFVLSEEVRAGCGAPGRAVRFYRDGVPLDPVVAWRAGRFGYPDVPEFVPAQVIIAPNAGSRGAAARGSASRSVAIALDLLGIALVGIGFVSRARLP